jgi:FkbM family methyltransferase
MSAPRKVEKTERARVRMPAAIALSCAFFVRNFPINRKKELFVDLVGRWIKEPQPFSFYSRQLNVWWSGKAMPDRLARHMLIEGMYQQDVLAAFELLQPGDLVLDVGGHHGLMAIVAAKKVLPHGKVISFEPNPFARAIFDENCTLNAIRNVQIEPFALSDHPGSAKFYIQKGSVTWNSSFFRDFACQNGRDEVEETEVPVSTLDEYAAARSLRPAFLKIDAEGSEFLILKGALRMIEKCRPILSMEFNPESAIVAGTTIEAMQTLLEELGYQLIVLGRTWTGTYHLKHQTPFSREQHCASDLINVLCLPRQQIRAGLPLRAA